MNAAVILQTYLDELAAAVLKNDWETYQQGVILPLALITHDESKVIRTEEELRAGFETFRMTFAAHRVTDYIRLVDQAEQSDRDVICGSYASHIIAGGHRVIAPFQSLITLRLVDNRWRAASVTNGLANSRWPLVRLELLPEAQGPKT